MSSLNTKPRLTRLGHKGWDNFWLWCKVGLTIAQTHAQLELIPGPLCWKWRNSRGYLICHKMMDLGSVKLREKLYRGTRITRGC